jgi:hypothetical protein
VTPSPEDQLSKNQRWHLSASRLRGPKRDQAIEVMASVKTVGDLNADHRGWQIDIREHGFVNDFRQIDFDGIDRTYERDGVPFVALLCKEYEKPYKHSVRSYPSSTPCELLWQSRKPRSRR